MEWKGIGKFKHDEQLKHMCLQRDVRDAKQVKDARHTFIPTASHANSTTIPFQLHPLPCADCMQPVDEFGGVPRSIQRQRDCLALGSAPTIILTIPVHAQTVLVVVVVVSAIAAPDVAHDILVVVVAPAVVHAVPDVVPAHAHAVLVVAATTNYAGSAHAVASGFASV
ncbi:hypothetical protein EUX98_g8840 [Antrodiella citrinella]|uniref:Uncharacterized protein n=1 Tax=Antrodiella citrinella TaxID=2447956 RepID=A0A4S4M271_9APHY|nr:hypothetical protein EUX98_g8840 [Antrodiella citrinella]